jgi:hypothetical protein
MAFEVCGVAAHRRIADMLLAGYGGRWLLPLWPDAQRTAAALPPGAAAIGCATDGFDFAAGGAALLWAAPNSWEVAKIDSVGGSGLMLSSPLAGSWPAGTRLYPLRAARLRAGAEAQQLGDDASRRQLEFDIDEPCDWPALTSPTLYLGRPVLTVRPDESDASSSGETRLLQTVDYEAALPFSYDLPGLALRTQSTQWKLHRRPAHSWFRSLLYTLRGRVTPMWLPSFASDLKIVADIAANDVTLACEWSGYAVFGLGKVNRRDIRIELGDGTIYYRRITHAADAGATETLTLDSALSTQAIAASHIRVTSFMALCTLGSDSVELSHVTDQDGLATATLGWEAVVPDA